MFGILLFVALIIADIIRIFKDDDEFDGIMLFARPIVAFVGALLLDGTFWQALLWAVGWGIIGFVISMLISEYYPPHSHSSFDPTTFMGTNTKTSTEPHKATQNSGHVESNKEQNKAVNIPTKTQPIAPVCDPPDKGYTSIQLKDTGDGFEICQTCYVESEGISNFYIDYEDGRIFIDWKDGSPQEIIGYYEQEADPVNLAKVFDRSKKRIIGRVGNELIYFRSREADPATGRYFPEEECLAYYTKNGNITALGALPYMGFFQGSELGGAAAFVAIFNAYKFKGVYRDYFEMDPDDFKEKHHKYLHPMGL